MASPKQPQDHKMSRSEQFKQGLRELGIAENVLPAGLRLRQRNEVMDLAFQMKDVLGGDEDAEEVEIDIEDLDPETLGKLLDVLARFDEILGREALDDNAYDAWSRAAGYDSFGNLLTMYAGALGESTSSTN